MLFSVNDIIKWKFNSETKIERILWIRNSLVVLIDINEPDALPELRKLDELEQEIIANNIEIVMDDPYIKIIKEKEISFKQKELRNTAWNIVSKIVHNEPDIYYRETRGTLIKEVCEEFGISKKTAYKYLRKYWKRGMTINALLPDYDKCGAEGTEKSAGNKKRGRPKKFGRLIGEGVNIDEETKKIFRTSIKKYYYNKKEITLRKTYELMLREFYSEVVPGENNSISPLFDEEKSVPTYEQFRYWFKKEFNTEDTIIKRKGDINHSLKNRAVLGKSDTGTLLGPGSRYEIDATVGDVYLVSSFYRDDIIGRPVIYFVIDVFSRLITGIYVGLEGPSWIGAMIALANATSDKVKFCGEYGIDIEEKDWPSYHFPEAILADRGELAGKKPETAIQNLNVKVENLPPYRADWKGIVEQHFRITNERTKLFLPGAVKKNSKEVKDRNYRLDAVLDLYQFTEIIIQCALYHNKSHYLNNYEKDKHLIADDVPAIPIKLWQWGIKNRSGRLRTFPEDIIRLNLMPSATATVTYRGIKFDNYYYSCETAMQERWFEKARINKSWKINISYDPRCMDYLYIPSNDGRSYERCFLIDHKNRFSNKSYEDIKFILEKEKLEKEMHIPVETQAKFELDAAIENIVKKGKKMKDQENKTTVSKNQRIKGIRKHRQEEKRRMRTQKSWKLGVSETELQEEKKQDLQKTKSSDNHYNLDKLKEWRRNKGGRNDN